ncbi:hypothetical protein [Pimelobacter simplex]|uniref:hypothetical protein n=1 Tax=Nocardioides simplex TaxID=2045 RepID=UPI003AADB38A
MPRTSTAQHVADELRDLVDAVSPTIESAAHALADRIPEPVVDRLPDAVTDHLPSHGRGRRRKLLLLAGLGAVGAAVFVAIRRSQVPAPQHEPRATTYPRATEPPASPGPGGQPG